MPQVIISTVGPYHAYEAARAASQAGYLKKFIVGFYNPREQGIRSEAFRKLTWPNYLGYAIQQFPSPGSIYFSYAIRDPLFDRLAARHIEPCDVFHGWNHQSLYSMRRAKQLGAKVIITRSSAHAETQVEILREEYQRFGIPFPEHMARLINRHVQEYEEADVIDVCSEFVWRTMVEKGIPPEKLRLLPMGFDPGRFMTGERTETTFRVMFAGLISIQKGVHYLLEAFKRLALPDAELILVGGKAQDSRLFLPKYSGLYRHVPFVPQDKLPALYNSSSVFVLPSLQEGFGMVVAEAAASGLPVIISENVGATIRDGVDGYVVPVRDVDALADRLLTLYRDQSLRQAMGRSAHEYIQGFTWQRYHDGLLQIYRELSQ